MESIYDFVLERNQEVFTTAKVEGFLECFFLSVSQPVRVRISSARFPEVVLFSCVDFRGASLVSLRTDGFNVFREKYNHNPVRFFLEEPLLVEIHGAVGTSGKLVVRWTSA